MNLHLGVISVMPHMLSALNYGITGRAIQKGLVIFKQWNPRDWAKKPHLQVDDKPYGGGPGMVMAYEPVNKAIMHAKQQMPNNSQVIYLSPQGKHLQQHDLNNIVKNRQSLLFLAGRYEGIDERVLARHVDEEWSLGDFVLSGGELAAMVFIDAIVRLLPGCLGQQASAYQDSFMDGLLEHPHYTRPAKIDGHEVPSVLLGGNHHDIARWRRKESLGKTWLKRPDLLKKTKLSQIDKELLIEFKNEHEQSKLNL